MSELRKKPGRKGRFTKEQAEQFAALADMQHSLESIGKDNGVTKSTICRVIQKLKAGGYDA
ncbi:hypothetical protein RI537_12385 [Aeromonas salmonicida]|uniref:hypothetical protein n=1 Tax=Aeromonas salmonicida TaxID=645 RepID=UPI003418C701